MTVHILVHGIDLEDIEYEEGGAGTEAGDDGVYLANRVYEVLREELGYEDVTGVETVRNEDHHERLEAAL